MKTKRFISKLRAAIGFVALFAFTGAVIMLILGSSFGMRDVTSYYWPIAVGIVLFYAILSYLDEYLDRRILNSYSLK